MHTYPVVKGKIQQAIARARPCWFLFLKRDQLLLVLSTVQFVLFVPLAWWAHKHPRPPVELAMTHVLQKKRSPFLQLVIRIVSTLTGSSASLNVLVVPTALVLWARRLRLEAIMTVGISWMSTFVRALIRQVIYRPRPNPLLVHLSTRKQTKSFPSGHVTSSFAFWGWLFALGRLQRQRSRPWQKALLSIPVLCVVLVGPTRIYLGDHWTTDVLGGYLFGGTWLSLSLWLYLTLQKKRVLL